MEDNFMNRESLLSEDESSLIAKENIFNGGGSESLLSDESLLSETATPTIDSNIVSGKMSPEEEARRRREYFMNPEVQAEILLDNYLRNHGYIISGRERRNLKREFLRNAKKGKYRKLFQDLINGVNEENTEEKSEQQNASK